MSFIVMEGDNGTGKDTIADFLQNNYSFSIISRLPDISDLEHQAKNLSGISRINTFIRYNLKVQVFGGQLNAILLA